jgi:hypothetical protein
MVEKKRESIQSFFFCVPSIKPRTTISMVLINRAVSFRSCFEPDSFLSMGLHVAINDPVPLCVWGSPVRCALEFEDPSSIRVQAGNSDLYVV